MSVEKIIKNFNAIGFKTLILFCLFGVSSLLSVSQSNVARAQEITQQEAVSNKASADIPVTDKAVEKAAEKAAEKAVEKAVEKARKKATSDVVEKVAERAVEKAAEEETAKEELKAKRPDEWWTATKIHFAVFLIDVDSIDGANQSFMANVFVKLRWKDRRLANPEGQTRQMPLQEAWHPQIILANRQGLVSRSLPEVVQVEPDGTVTYRQRYSGMLSQPLQLANFPMDRHTFNVQFISAAYRANELQFIPEVSKIDPTRTGGVMSSELSLPDWEVLSYEALSKPYQPNREVNQAGFVFRFEARRYVEYYYWQVVLPLVIVVFMSWAAYWVRRGEQGVRIGVATSSILTLIAYRFVLADLIPHLPYMTRMDYFTVGCTLLVFIALVGVVVTAYLSTINRDIIAKHVDSWVRRLFPVAFLLLFGWFIAGSGG